MFSRAIPWSGTPFKSSLTPSHVSSTNSCRFLQVAEKVSLVAYSKYHSLFFILELNLCGFFSRSKWNLTQIAASTPTVDSSWKKNQKIKIRRINSFPLSIQISSKQKIFLSSFFIQTWEIIVYDIVGYCEVGHGRCLFDFWLRLRMVLAKDEQIATAAARLWSDDVRQVVLDDGFRSAITLAVLQYSIRLC